MLTSEVRNVNLIETCLCCVAGTMRQPEKDENGVRVTSQKLMILVALQVQGVSGS